MEWIQETEKGRTRFEFTPLSMYLRDCRPAPISRSRPCPIGGRFANSVRRSPEFIARTVLLPERFRVDCAVGGDTVALSHSRRDYTAPGAGLARQSSPGLVVAAQRKTIGGRCVAVHRLPRVAGFGLSSGPVLAPRPSCCYTVASQSGLVGCCLARKRLASQERTRRPGCGTRESRCRFFLHRGYPGRGEKLLSNCFYGQLFLGHGFCYLPLESGFVEEVWVFVAGFPKAKTCEAHLNPDQPVFEKGW